MSKFVPSCVKSSPPVSKSFPPALSSLTTLSCRCRPSTNLLPSCPPRPILSPPATPPPLVHPQTGIHPLLSFAAQVFSPLPFSILLFSLILVISCNSSPISSYLVVQFSPVPLPLFLFPSTDRLFPSPSCHRFARHSYYGGGQRVLD